MFRHFGFFKLPPFFFVMLCLRLVPLAILTGFAIRYRPLIAAHEVPAVLYAKIFVTHAALLFRSLFQTTNFQDRIKLKYDNADVENKLSVLGHRCTPFLSRL